MSIFFRYILAPPRWTTEGSHVFQFLEAATPSISSLKKPIVDLSSPFQQVPNIFSTNTPPPGASKVSEFSTRLQNRGGGGGAFQTLFVPRFFCCSPVPLIPFFFKKKSASDFWGPSACFFQIGVGQGAFWGQMRIIGQMGCVRPYYRECT